MEFIETPIFTSQVEELLSDDEYRGLQLALVLRPEQGSVIPGGGGLRKMRWTLRGKGKRGGVRVVYYWIAAEDQFYMLFAYPKTRQSDLSKDQLRILRRLAKEEFK